MGDKNSWQKNSLLRKNRAEFQSGLTRLGQGRGKKWFKCLGNQKAHPRAPDLDDLFTLFRKCLSQATKETVLITRAGWTVFQDFGNRLRTRTVCRSFYKVRGHPIMFRLQGSHFNFNVKVLISLYFLGWRMILRSAKTIWESCIVWRARHFILHLSSTDCKLKLATFRNVQIPFSFNPSSKAIPQQRTIDVAG